MKVTLIQGYTRSFLPERWKEAFLHWYFEDVSGTETRGSEPRYPHMQFYVEDAAGEEERVSLVLREDRNPPELLVHGPEIAMVHDCARASWGHVLDTQGLDLAAVQKAIMRLAKDPWVMEVIIYPTNGGVLTLLRTGKHFGELHIATRGLQLKPDGRVWLRPKDGGTR